MGFIAPAVHYSALATLPPELTSSKSQHIITHTASIRVKLSEIFKKLLNNGIHNEQIQLPKTTVCLPETIEKENDISAVVSGNRTSPKSMPSLIEPLERLPFTEPYFSTAPKNEKIPFELSAYHKHCIHQQKYIDQKQYHPPIKQLKTVQPNSIRENRSDSTNYQLKNSVRTIHTFFRWAI